MTAVEQFKSAIHARDAVALRRVLAESADARAAINEPIFGFDSPALVSVASGRDIDVIEALLEFGADPNRRSDWWAGGFHALHGASGPIADRLIAAGAIPDACAAARLDRPDLLREILEQEPARVQERGGDGQTPLHFARSPRVVDLLLDAGAEIDARDIDHRSTAAEWMTGDVQKPEESRHDLARYLVERGASVDIFLAAALGLTEQARSMVEKDPKLLELRTAQGEYGERPPSSYHIYHWTLGANRSPLQVAADRGHDETVRAMLAFAEPGERLLLACHRGDEGVAREIVRDHPGLVQRLTPAQARALTDAAWEGSVSTIELMLELGFDPSTTGVTGPTGGTALHCAAWKGSVPIVKALLQHPKSQSLLEVPDAEYGGTPLSWCGHGSRDCTEPAADHAAVAQLLIDAGAHVDPHLLDWTGTNVYKEVIRLALKTR